MAKSMVVDRLVSKGSDEDLRSTSTRRISQLKFTMQNRINQKEHSTLFGCALYKVNILNQLVLH